MARYLTVNDIINRAALEIGLQDSSSPVSDVDDTFKQMVALLDSAGQEMCELNAWPVLVKNYRIFTGEDDTGIYDLPNDFNYMIDQTGWDRTNRVALGGPLSAQDWTYLVGRDLVSSTIYVSFRQVEGKLYVFPQPPPEGMEITFEYISRDWLQEVGEELGQEAQTRDTIGDGSNVCLLPGLMMIKFLKLKWLQAKGMDASNAALEFDTLFQGQIGKSEGASILSAGQNGRNFPYLNPLFNVGDSGYGR